MSRIISDLVASTAEPLRRTVALMEAAREAPEEVKAGLRATVASMERELYGVLGYTCGQIDWLTSEMGGAVATRPAELGRSPAPPGGSGAPAGPRIVTRGSGRKARTKRGGRGAV